MSIYLELFVEFFKIGLFSIGGGAATIPYLYELSESKGWFTVSQLMNFIAVAESTPGAIGVNMATFSGFLAVDGNIYEQALGACCATLGLVAPSVLIIIIISFFLNRFKRSKIVQYIFYGLRPASVALITYALYKLLKPVMLNIDLFNETSNIFDMFNLKSILIAVVLWFMIKKHKAHPLFFIVLSAVVGIMLKL